MKPYLRAIFLLFLILPSARWGEAKIFDKIKTFLSKFSDEKIKNFPSRDEQKKLREYSEKFTEIIDFVQQKPTPPPPPMYRLQPKSPPPPPNAPPKQIIKGLSVVKDYLSDYGYIESSGPFNDSFDQEIISAIKTYQNFSNLNVTGDLNKQLIQQILSIRCGVPDVNFDYNFTDDNISYPKAGHRWFPNRNLTYGFLPENQIPDNMTKVFRDSFARWAQASGTLSLTETTYDNADIQVGFYNFTALRIEVEVYGGSLIFLQPDSSKKGVVLMDGNMGWLLPSENATLSKDDGVLDLETVAMHQIGHLLGLDHSHKEDSVMYPYILSSQSQQRKVQLSNSDKANIHLQFAKHDSDLTSPNSHDSDLTSPNSHDSASHGGRLDVLLVTTSSLGFAYLLLLLY
ncbi:metalloendoproteinase 1-like isoform X1 [Glycine soja]|uniref:metalloendoproteinase 1-like isoform X1 n=1 Tax=Glycine soja TaxID=3848 RepID=UPI00103AB6ED|nr:metalloendoproteinase 1-like isoform X1 [Glycine soja]